MLYKYLTSEPYVDAFIGGAIWFHPLTFFRLHEETNARRDWREGMLVHRPTDGLVLNGVDGKNLHHPTASFVSEVRINDIFVHCLSTTFSDELMTRFKAIACVEITHPNAFYRRVRTAWQRRPYPDKRVVHGRVDYRPDERYAKGDWEFPDKIVLMKPAQFAWQSEYRLAVAATDGFQFKNRHVSFENVDARVPTNDSPPDPIVLEVGNVSKLCNVRRP